MSQYVGLGEMARGGSLEKLRSGVGFVASATGSVLCDAALLGIRVKVVKSPQ